MSDIHNNSRLLKANTVNKHVFEYTPIELCIIQIKSQSFYQDENGGLETVDKLGIYESTESLNYSELLNLETFMIMTQ